MVYDDLVTNIPNNNGLLYLSCICKESLDETWGEKNLNS